MAKSLTQRVADSRRLLLNPYAYLNDSGSYSVLIAGEVVEIPADDRIRADRRLLKDPYAHLDDTGQFSAAQDFGPPQAQQKDLADERLDGTYASLLRNKGHRHVDSGIEAIAKELQRRMWTDRKKLWPDTTPQNPIDVLDPTLAFRLVGYDFSVEDTLGQYHKDGRQIEVAGIIDDAENQVRISRQFPFEVRNYTTAHELGHALLHRARGLHRDKPLDGTTVSRDPVEYEADKFAAYFLMPQRVVTSCFRDLFGTEFFSLDEGTAFALSRGTGLDLEKDCRSLRELSRILAKAESYNGNRFRSLAQQFRVSVEAMAIRIEELGLVAY